MKKVAKFFLPAVIGFLFIGLTYAQNWGEPYYDSVIGPEKCMCGMPMIEVIDRMFLMLIGFILLTLSICTIFFKGKLKKIGCKSKLINIPILNLYLLFDNTVGKLWFYIMVFCIGFLVYGIYVNRNGCCSYSTPFKYCILAVGVFSLLALLVIIGIMSHRLEKKLGGDNKNLR